MLDDANPTGMRLLCLHGQGGTGKSVMLQKIAALTKSEGKLVSICASTNLAALAFKNGTTAHQLFNYPVIEDQDVNDGGSQIDCNPSDERLEHLQALTMIGWEECFSSHHDHLDAVMRLLQINNPHIILVVIGDGRQCPPVVPSGSAAQTILASIQSSKHWKDFKVC